MTLLYGLFSRAISTDMLNEFTSYTSNLDATKNDSTYKIKDQGYCSNGTDIGRPVTGSLSIPPPSSSWNYPYLNNLYNYYNPHSYELGNAHQYDNQKCSSQYVRNYNENTSRFHSTSVLQCCDPRCQVIAKHPKYSYYPVNSKINQHANKHTKNYYSSIINIPKPDTSVTPLAPPIEHTKYTPCIPYPTLRNDLNSKYSNQQNEFYSPFTNTLKHGSDSGSFNEYYTNIGNPSYWNKPNSSIWNRNSSCSYYPSIFEEKNAQKIDQENSVTNSDRSILFNRLLDHRDHPYNMGYSANYHGAKNDSSSNINHNQSHVPCESFINDNRLPVQTNSYQAPSAYNIHYPSSEIVSQYYKENTPKEVPEVTNQDTRILDKNPHLDVREFLSTWEDDIEDEKVTENTSENPVIVLDCSNLEDDILAKVKEKLSNSTVGNDNTTMLKIVEATNSESATILSPRTSVIQENTSQSKEITEKPSSKSSHMNSDGYMTWYSNNKKKDDFSYDLVEMTERLVNTVGKLLSDPEKKVKPISSSIKKLPQGPSEDSHHINESHQQSLLPQLLSNQWNSNSNIKKNVGIPTTTGCHLESVSTPKNALQDNYTSKLLKSQQSLIEKNASGAFNLQNTSNDIKLPVSYPTQQNDYYKNTVSDVHSKLKSIEFSQPYYQYNKASVANPDVNISNFKSYSACSSYYENAGYNYDQTKLYNANSYYNGGVKDNINYMDHIEKQTVSDTDITLVKADLEKSLNDISHHIEPNNSNIEKHCQYFDSNCSSITDIIPKQCDIISPINQRNKVTEIQTHNRVIQKTGTCNSHLQKSNNTECNDNNLLSMPSLSPPPNSSSVITSPITSLPLPQNNESSLSAVNLTLTDVYENEDTIFDSSQEAEPNNSILCSAGHQTPINQTYQPLNLALSRNSKSEDLNSKDNHICEDESNKISEQKTNSKADDGYYSVENAEVDDISVNNLRKMSQYPISVAYYPCITSHEPTTDTEIHCNDISEVASSYKDQQSNITNQSQIIDDSNLNVNAEDNLIHPITEQNKDNIDEILQESVISSKPEILDQIQLTDSNIPEMLLKDVTDQNIVKNSCNSDADKKFEECDSSSCCNLPNLETTADTFLPHSTIEPKISGKSKKLEENNNTELDKNKDNPINSQESNKENIALNLKMQFDTLNCSVSNESVIKETVNFTHFSNKENSISLVGLENNQEEILINSTKETPKLDFKSSTFEFNEQHSQPIGQRINGIEKDNSVQCELNGKLKSKLIDTSISNINLPMKKRKSQEYMSQKFESLESTVESSVLVTSIANSITESSHSATICLDQCEENKNPINKLRKNKKKRKKEKSKDIVKYKKYSKFKRRLSFKDQIKYRRSYSFNKNKLQSFSRIEKNPKEDAISSSPAYDDNDDIFNIPSIAPTPQFDLIQDFEPTKDQFNEESSQSIMPANFSSRNCKDEFVHSSSGLPHMLKAPSPNCILQDDTFVHEKLSSKVISPYCDLNCGGTSPSSVAPSPNYDIIEGVLFDDTDSSRNNEDNNCKNERCFEFGKSNGYRNFEDSLNNFNRSTKYNIRKNEYESDYETDRYYLKRKRNSLAKHLAKKLKGYPAPNYYQSENKCCGSSEFSFDIFRHFDYAVDEERFTRSEDDEYEPRPNHIRHMFKCKPHSNYLRVKDNGKHIKKYNLKYNQCDKKIIDSKCDLYFNKKKSTYISSPENHSPVNVSKQCDRIISAFQTIKPTSNLEIFVDDDKSCQSPSNNIENSDVSPNCQLIESHCNHSDETLCSTNNSNNSCIKQDETSLILNCNEESTNVAMKILPEVHSAGNCIKNEVPPLRLLAVEALSKAAINNNVLEVRETPEHTEIIIHSDEHHNSAGPEDGNSSNIIRTEACDDDTHISSNFEAIKEMTFDYPTSPEVTSSICAEKNDEDLPCQCLIISNEESILCLRCSLNSSVVSEQFHEMSENREVSVSSVQSEQSDSTADFDCVEGNCIEQSFIDQEINVASNSPIGTSALANSSCSSPLVVNVDDSASTEHTQIKVQLPWHKIFNLGGETNDGDALECNGASRQRMLELGPAQIKIKMLSDKSGWWNNHDVSGNSSPVVKVRRLVLQRAAAEEAATDVATEESCSTAPEEKQELVVAVAVPEVEMVGEMEKSCKDVEDDERQLKEILGVPKMVIKKTSCSRYKSFLRTHRILQPVVRLTKNQKLDELALKYRHSSKPCRIRADNIEANAVQTDMVTIDVGEEIVSKAEKVVGEVGAGVRKDEDVGTSAQVAIRSHENNSIEPTSAPVSGADSSIKVELYGSNQTKVVDIQNDSVRDLSLDDGSAADQINHVVENAVEEQPAYCSSKNHVLHDVRTHLTLRPERHHCLLCHLSYNCSEAYQVHLKSRFHRHLELMQRETVHALYRRFTGRLCPSLRPLSAKERKIMKWKPRNADVNHFYHHKTPLQIALRLRDARYHSNTPRLPMSEMYEMICAQSHFQSEDTASILGSLN